MRLQLEDWAEEYGLYYGSKKQDLGILKKLYQNETIKTLIEKCKEYRESPECKDDDLYRKFDGSCNNLKHPLWGAADGPMERILPANYIGIRRFNKFASLPQPRQISESLGAKSNPSPILSAFFTFFGQLLVHDMTLAPSQSANATVPCCQPEYQNHSACSFNIYVREDDPFYCKFNVTCMLFRRTAPFPACDFSRRTQLNKITSFLDASFMYGSNHDIADSLLSTDGTGRLKTQHTLKGDILPANTDELQTLCPINKTRKCFASGDERVNQHFLLISLHTMMLRFHNRIADVLRSLNPHWDGNKVFQESRRIVIALWQNIVYNEYLPLLIGRRFMRKYNLFVDRDSLYDNRINPNILVEFSTAAFRLHSMVPTKVSKFSANAKMRNIFSNTEPVHNGTWKTVVAGTCELPSEQNDHYVVKDVTNHLYRPPGADFGFDLVSINIQRGRDHGLPTYADVVYKCSTLRLRFFSDLNLLMTPGNIALLKRLYRDVKHIDLWIGMLLEEPVKRGAIGPTAACVVSKQFHSLKFGDSFFFSHKNGRNPFTEDQLRFIRSYSITRFLCDTINFLVVREHPFTLPRGLRNPTVDCYNLPPLDLEDWKENSFGLSSKNEGWIPDF